MSEINNFANLALNMEQLIGTTLQTAVQKTVQIAAEESGLETNDGKDITTKDPKNNNNTNLSFIEHSPITAIFAGGFSIPSTHDTKQALSIGFSIAVSLGNRAVSNDKINIQGDAVTSVLLNFAVFAFKTPIQNPHNFEERKQAFSATINTLEKMIDDNTSVDSFNEEEKKFLWDKASIKVEKNPDGKVDYLYYESPDSQPKKLSKQELINIKSHVSNIVNDESLFIEATEMGGKLDQQIAKAREDEKKEQEVSEEKKHSQEESKKEEFENTQQHGNSNKLPDLNEKLINTKNNSIESNYINAQTERIKEDEKYHNMKVNEITKERLHKNQERANKLTEEAVKKIRDEAY